MPAAAERYFANYKQIPPRVPGAVWMISRLLMLAATLGLAFCLFVTPLGLRLFWGLAIPLLPALFVVAPGLWRQVCPMALMNQLPVLAGRPSTRDLPDVARQWAFTIAVGSFVVLIGLRAPLLNHNGALVGSGILGALILALLGGLAFKGRSGWCGTFCPLGPVQRDYGHAPLLLVRNGYCETCVGCQKNCYDFNPRAAVFEDLGDADPIYAGQRRFFMAMMPGLVLGYFMQPGKTPYGDAVFAVTFLASIGASVGLYQAAVSFLRLDPFRTTNLFACLALAEFYWFSGPIILSTIHAIWDVHVPLGWIDASRFAGVPLAVALCDRGWANEEIFRRASKSAEQLSVDQTSRSLRDRLEASTAALVTDAKTGTTFPVAPNQTLLEAMEAARIEIGFGCRAGLCGADAVIIRSGYDHLSPPGEDERVTLQRAGLDGIGRLACMCRVNGDVTIDREVTNARRSFVAAVASNDDPLKVRGISRVLIVGNGVAGITVADNLRRRSGSVRITVITDEPHHFYNRMAVGRMIHGRSTLDELALLPEHWYPEHRVEVRRDTIAVSVDRETRVVRLGTGEALPYNFLVLATGADALLPTPDYARFSNAFVLRGAEDALAVRMRAQGSPARKAVVIGGGVLGIEAADALRLLGMKVTLLHRAPRLMDRQLDEQGAKRLAQYLDTIGIDVRTQAVVARLAGERALEAVELADGTRVSGDVFVACVGVSPRLDLAKSCGLEVGRGIKVDNSMRSSDTAIYAVGDAAELPEAIGGFWPVAVAHAAACVSGMLDGAGGYQAPPAVLELKCDGIDLRSFGRVEVTEGDEVIRAREDAPAWWRFVLRDGRLVGAIVVGPPGAGRDFGRIIQPEADLSAVLNELRQGRIEALARL